MTPTAIAAKASPSGVSSPIQWERCSVFENKLGTFFLGREHSGQWRSYWLDEDDAAQLPELDAHRPLDAAVRKQVQAYFAGRAADFSMIATPSGPDFFHRCWAACRRIKPGQPISYGELARRAGSPAAVRAAGQAMRRNPLPIIVPCHRVVASTGKLHGFSGQTDPKCAALQRKKRLLELERDQ